MSMNPKKHSMKQKKTVFRGFQRLAASQGAIADA